MPRKDYSNNHVDTPCQCILNRPSCLTFLEPWNKWWWPFLVKLNFFYRKKKLKIVVLWRRSKREINYLKLRRNIYRCTIIYSTDKCFEHSIGFLSYELYRVSHQKRNKLKYIIKLSVREERLISRAEAFILTLLNCWNNLVLISIYS